MGTGELAVESGSAIHSCARLAAFPALLLMPLNSLVRTLNQTHFCRLQMPWEHPCLL